MNQFPELKGKTVVIPSATSDNCGSLVVDVLEKCGGIVCHGSTPEDFRHNDEQLAGGDFIVMAETGTPVENIIPPQYTPAGILWFYRGSRLEGRKPGDALDIEAVSANDVAKKVAELIDCASYKVPEWLTGYSFRWSGGVTKHPISKERCREIELFKTNPKTDSDIKEHFTVVYLDTDGNIFQISTDGDETKEIVNSESNVLVRNGYKQTVYGGHIGEKEKISFYRS